MAKSNACDEGFYIIGGESDGKVRLTEDGRRILGINKKVVKDTKFFGLVLDTKRHQK